jgi:hypothetical protein
MGTLLRWPFLPVLLIGIANIPVWCAVNAFWGVDRWSLMLLMGLAFMAGWYTQEKLWGTALVMLAPTMFIGGAYHGHPWLWLMYGRYAYFVQSMTPFIIGYCVIIGIGRLVRTRLVQRRLS